MVWMIACLTVRVFVETRVLLKYNTESCLTITIDRIFRRLPIQILEFNGFKLITL